MVSVPAGSSTGQVGLPLNAIERVDFPEPAQLKAARVLLARGKTGEARDIALQVMNYFGPFRDVPGNFWADAAALSVQSLVSDGRDKEADKVIAEMLQSVNLDTQRLARVEQAARGARQGRHEEALAIYDEVIAQSTDPETLAAAWLNMGDSLLALNQAEPALLAYLRLPVLYPQSFLLVPAALLGSAQALEALEDFAGAEAWLNVLLRDYPQSPTAVAAQKALKRLKRKES